MPADMGTFRVDVEIENPARPGERRTLRSVLVDTGAELSWVPGESSSRWASSATISWHFRQADGTVLERWTGIVVLSVSGKRTGDDVVFGHPGDLVLLGSRTLEGSTSASSRSRSGWWMRGPRLPPQRCRLTRAQAFAAPDNPTPDT